MKIREVENPTELGAEAADLIQRIVEEVPEAHLCLPTGASPLTLYQQLVAREVDLSRCRITKLDEWAGVPMDDPATCEAFLWTHLLGPLGYPRDRYLAFDSMADPAEECRRVAQEKALRGRFDVCILGIGMNGHLGLIEPAEELAPHAHVAALTEESRRHAMLTHLATPPRYGMTFGVADLLQARQVLLLVSGEAKRGIFGALRDGPVTTRLPASLLKLHPDCRVLIDRAASG